MSTGRLAAALAAVLVASPAFAYVRTADPGTGKPLSWPIPVVPYLVNPARQATSPSCAATPDADPAVAAVRASFAAWEQSCSNLRLVYGGATDVIRTGRGQTTTQNIVVFRHGWCSQHPVAKDDPCRTDPDVDCGGIYGCFEDASQADWSIVALTSVLYDPGSGRIIDADIEVNDWDGEPGSIVGASQPPHGWYFTCADRVQGPPGPTICQAYGDPDCLFIDLRNTLTHEAGHFVGLAHAPQPGSTMFATTTPADQQKRSLSEDDVAGVCAIYPEGSGGGGCGCGSAGAGGIVPLLVAGLALRRRRLTPR